MEEKPYMLHVVSSGDKLLFATRGLAIMSMRRLIDTALFNGADLTIVITVTNELNKACKICAVDVTFGNGEPCIPLMRTTN